ncbi:DgyrCDS8233 [Dimorphilus gyrociliatus]|uniref:DgyrCDS8233 n=1 Tax=Dimorphilus gyrociliatus TaxID=2664684 RepID=A0A7I8VV97_9ANNE|nr:DgyrCDS8233 [Dimorphilus gyrociliatus]
MFKAGENPHDSSIPDTSQENGQLQFSLRNNPNFRKALKANEDFLEAIGITKDLPSGLEHISYIRKLCTMFSFDWSRFFSAGRNEVYSYYLRHFKQKVEVDVIKKQMPRSNIVVLLSDVGLGRLLNEIRAMGFSIICHFSDSHLADAYEKFEKKCREGMNSDSLTIYPYFSHRKLLSKRKIDVTFPETEAIELLNKTDRRKQDYRMAVGNFVNHFGHDSMKNNYKIIITGRKLSNIPDVISFIEAVYLVLDNDGIWIHQGIYEENEIEQPKYPQLTRESLVDIARMCGFKIVENSTGLLNDLKTSKREPMSDKIDAILQLCFVKN